MSIEVIVASPGQLVKVTWPSGRYNSLYDTLHRKLLGILANKTNKSKKIIFSFRSVGLLDFHRDNVIFIENGEYAIFLKNIQEGLTQILYNEKICYVENFLISKNNGE